MKGKITESFLQQTVGQMLTNRNLAGAVLCVESEDDQLSWTGAGGNIKPDDRYFLTSVSKLCVTALILRLQAENRLQLEDRISKHLPEPMLEGLHVYRGKDYSQQITIAHLLANTSGLPDYLAYKANGKTADSGLNEGRDEAWPLDLMLERVKAMKTGFSPGQRGKVAYSNTNYRLLGEIIAGITGKPIGDVFQTHIFDELNLTNTYAFTDIEDRTPVPMYYKAKQLHIPRCIASVTAEGGLISTARESMAILKAFFRGHLFPREYIQTLKQWQFILFPYQFYFGLGLEKLWVPWILSPKRPIREILGFWGSSGAFAFYNPDTDLYFTGTVNQSSGLGHGAAFKAILKIIKSA